MRSLSQLQLGVAAVSFLLGKWRAGKYVESRSVRQWHSSLIKEKVRKPSRFHFMNAPPSFHLPGFGIPLRAAYRTTTSITDLGAPNQRDLEHMRSSMVSARCNRIELRRVSLIGWISAYRFLLGNIRPIENDRAPCEYQPHGMRVLDVLPQFDEHADPLHAWR